MLQLIINLLNITESETIEISEILITYCLSVAKWFFISTLVFLAIAALLYIFVVILGATRKSRIATKRSA